MQHLLGCVNSLSFSPSVWSVRARWPQLGSEMSRRRLHTRMAGYGIPGLYKPPWTCKGWHGEGAMQGLRSVGCPAHPSSCCELHSGLCSPQIRRNVLPVCFAPRKKSNIFSVYIESGKTCAAQVLKETAGLLRCPMGPGQSCYKKYQC